MSFFALISLLVALTAILAWLNDRLGKLPTSIGVMFGGLTISLILIISDQVFQATKDTWIQNLVNQIDFGALLVNIPAHHPNPGSGSLLGLLLFATAVRIEPSIFKRVRISLIAWLSTGGVLITAFGTAFLLMIAIKLTEGQAPFFLFMLLFAAILAPTDPVAIMDLLKRAGVSRTIRDVIGGEALLNDAASIVLFLFLIGVASGQVADTSMGHIITVFSVEVVAGIGVGLVVGGIASFLIRTARRTIVVVLLTLAAAMATCIITPPLHGSVPLSSVTCGLIIGRIAIARRPATEEETTNFWWVIENALTTIIFLLVGLELLVVHFNYLNIILWSLFTVPILFVTRLIAILIPMVLSRIFTSKWLLTRGQATLMSWCGIRGTVSLAMAIAIPAELLDHHGLPVREQFLGGIFTIVLVTLIVQGLPLGRIARRLGETDSNQLAG